MKFDAFCVFAEAIDQLADGRMVYHGVYPPHVVTPAGDRFQKLVIGLWIRFFEVPESPPNLTIEIQAPDEVPFRSEATADFDDDDMDNAHLVDDESPMITFRTFTRVDFEPKSTGDFVVMVEVNGSKKYAGSFFVDVIDRASEEDQDSD